MYRVSCIVYLCHEQPIPLHHPLLSSTSITPRNSRTQNPVTPHLNPPPVHLIPIRIHRIPSPGHIIRPETPTSSSIRNIRLRRHSTLDEPTSRPRWRHSPKPAPPLMLMAGRLRQRPCVDRREEAAGTLRPGPVAGPEWARRAGCAGRVPLAVGSALVAVDVAGRRHDCQGAAVVSCRFDEWGCLDSHRFLIAS